MSQSESLSRQDVAQAIQVMRASVCTHYGEEVDPLPLAGIGLTQRAWRRSEVEDCHGGQSKSRITDGEMFAANVATTRLVLEHIRTYAAIDWNELVESLVKPDRIAGRRTVSDLLGDLYRPWSDSAYSVIMTQHDFMVQHGYEFFLWFNASQSLHSTEWWGSPRWPLVVDRFINHLATPPPSLSCESLRQGLLDAPDELDPTVLGWCISNGIGFVRT